MRRHRPLPWLVAAIVAVVASVASSTPAPAQVDQAELAGLRARATELQAEVDALSTTIDETNASLAEVDAILERQDVELELKVDDYAEAVTARNNPARLSQVAAVESFINGDPRSEAALEEVASLDANSDASTRREVYDAIISDALEDMNNAEARLTDVAVEVRELKQTQADAAARRQGLIDLRTETLAVRAETITGLRAVRLRLSWLQSLDGRWVLTGLDGFEGEDRPALAVKIDNVAAARPQAGLNEADIVYEERVEAGFTRLIAVYHSTPVDAVGPVRSIRTSDPKILANLNSPLLANSGGNRGAQKALADSTLIDVGALPFPEAYYRDRRRRRPHNLFSSTETLWNIPAPAAGKAPPVFRFRVPGDPLPAAAKPVSTVDIDYGETSVNYTWNGFGWSRSQDGRPHVDAQGVGVSATSVIVQFIGYSPSAADGASPEADVVGNGRVWVLIEGHIIEGTWDRVSAEAPTIYRDPEGDIISITAGRTWVALPQVDNPASFE